MTGLIEQILMSLRKGRVVTLHGDSGIGKSETMRLLKCLLEQDGKRSVYLDMRYIRGIPQLHQEISKQLGVYNKRIYSELQKGDVALLLDEYWAGAGIANSLIQFAHKQKNNIVTVAGNPIGVKLDEYILSPRST